jgi:NAD(P)-dependent dehydrogenase (short-subunit alcohol dehydrogenase family)
MHRREETVDGLEATFATNHLAHFLLTELLLPHIKKRSDGRIIVLTSGMHKKTKAYHFDDMQVRVMMCIH